MLKKFAFTIAIVYLNDIATQKTSVKVARKMRNLMKPYIEFWIEFEKDRNEIVQNEELSTDEKQKEINDLINEIVELPILIDSLLDLCEEWLIELPSWKINELYSYEW